MTAPFRRVEVGRFPLYGEVDIEIVVEVLVPMTLLRMATLDGGEVLMLPISIEISTVPPEEPLVLHPTDSVRLSTLLTDALPIIDQVLEQR